MLKTKKKWLILPLLLTVLLFAAAFLTGNVYFSKDNGGDSNTVFIAGNPDLYPLERYNENTGEYEGVLPELFKAISEETGIEFTYVYASAEDRQETLAKNNQADVISAMVVGEAASEYVSGSTLALGFTVDGKTYEAHIGFTAICDEDVRLAITNYLTNLPQETLTEMAVSYVMANPASKAVPDFVWWGIGAVVFVLLLTIVMLSSKISKLRKKQTELLMYESKTGLYNEDYIMEYLSTLVPVQSQKIYYLAYISVNEEKLLRYYGKETMGNVAAYIADVLKEHRKEKEYCARLGEVAFAYVFRAESYAIAEERVRSLTEELNARNNLKNEDYGMHVRAGVHALHFQLPRRQTPFDAAQTAFDWAEQKGEAYCFTSDALIREITRKARLQRETAQAVRKGEILFYLQYVVDTKTGEVAGAEAISRWQHKREGLLMPSVYVPLMQQAQTITLLDYYMFEKSCQQLEIWKKAGLTSFFLSCNFDRTTLSQEDFFIRISEIADKYDVDKSKMILEITEDVLEKNKEIVHNNTLLCVHAGYRIALDDFGNGFASFKNLLEFNVSHMKLDRGFIKQISSERGKMLLQGLISAVQSAGIKVIFEGVETAEQLDEVTRLGVDYVQGFYYSRVIPQIEGNRIFETINAKIRGEDLRSELRKTYDGYGEDDDVEEQNVFDADKGAWLRIRYNWSFLARLHRAPKEIAEYYTALKNELLSYRKVTSRVSWAFDSINFGRQQIAKFVMKPKCLMVYLALDPNEFADTKYFFKDMSQRKKYAQVPMRIKVKSERGLKHVMELIAVIAERNAFRPLAERNDKDYSLACLGIDELIELGLIKVNKTEVGKGQQLQYKSAAHSSFTQAVLTQREEDGAEQQNLAETQSQETYTIEINREMNIMENKNAVVAIGGTLDVNYRWSFTARLHKAPEEVAAYYTEIKNGFLQYKKVKSRVSWSCDTINFGRETLAKIVMAQKALYVYLALDPKDYEGSKYFFKDFSDKKKFEKVPMRIKVRSARGVRHVLELLEKLVEKYELKLAPNFVAENYALEDKSFEQLLEEGLIKRVERKQAEPEVVEEEIVQEEVAVTEVVEEPQPETTLNQNLEGKVEDIEAEEIHVQFLERLCRQFEADELSAHVKVVYKKKNEKKTSIFDVLMKRNNK